MALITVQWMFGFRFLWYFFDSLIVCIDLSKWISWYTKHQEQREVLKSSFNWSLRSYRPGPSLGIRTVSSLPLWMRPYEGSACWILVFVWSGKWLLGSEFGCVRVAAGRWCWLCAIKGYSPPTRSRILRKLIDLTHATGILMIKLVYAVVKYGNGRSSSVDVFTEVSFKHASFASAAGSLFTEALFQHPFNAETVFHVKPNIPNPRHLWKFTQNPSISKTPCPKGLSISSSPIEAAGQLLQMTLKLVDDKDGGLIRMPRNTIRMEDWRRGVGILVVWEPARQNRAFFEGVVWVSFVSN